MLFNNVSEESGSGLIWFVSLLALVAAFAGVLVSASDEFLSTRKLTDYAEQYALGLKTQLNLSPQANLNSLAKSLYTTTSSSEKLTGLEITKVTLESGETVHVEVCMDWRGPISPIALEKRICERAFAR